MNLYGDALSFRNTRLPARRPAARHLRDAGDQQELSVAVDPARGFRAIDRKGHGDKGGDRALGMWSREPETRETDRGDLLL